MTRQCVTSQSMSITATCLIFITMTSPLLSFPLHHLGGNKKVTHHVGENRDLILCWIVQIKTKCSCVADEVDADPSHPGMLDDVTTDRQLVNSGCGCGRREIRDHFSALSEELGLHVIHTFGRFHDHSLLCLMYISEIDAPFPRNTTFPRYKSQTMSSLHQQHASLKSRDKMLFDKHKNDVENRLLQHREVIWFSSEYVHRHHSRFIMTKQTDHPQSRHKEVPLFKRGTGKHMFVHLDPKHIRKPEFSVNLESGIIYASADSGRVSTVTLRNHTNKYRLCPTVNTTTELIYPENDKSLQPNLRDKSNVSSHIHRLARRSLQVNFNDPKYPKQWHLNNRMTKDMDINVTGVWQHNYTGRGVTVAVVDDGLEWRNPDLERNYNYKGSWDFNDDDHDPTPSATKLSNHHGTRCAGEIAAVANNRVCGVGVAFDSQISGLRVLDGLMTDSMEAEAFNKKMDINDVYSCSWGPDDDGRTVDGPHLMAAKAMKYGVDFGRSGYGSIYVLASGNGGENHDNCNFDGYANSIYTVTIGAVDDKGTMPYYAEECASMLGVTFSSGTANKRDIVTTDWTMGQGNGCTESHTGTSAAAPLAAAMIALMLQARPCLTWRDVQYIIILTGQKVDVKAAHSQINGAGLSHSHKHGFGLLNSWRLVNAARIWQMVPWLTSYSYAESDLNLIITKGEHSPLRVDHVVSERDIQGLSLFILENVQLTLSISHPCRGLVGVMLTSPSGTVSVLAAPRPKDNSTEGFKDWTFTSVRCWGEKPVGNWSFKVMDYDDGTYGQGKVTKWRLTLFGTPMTSEEFQDRRRRVESAMSGEFLHSNVLPCPPAPKFDPVYAPVSDRTLKILILTGAFCLIMAVYETFEYLFCYNDEKKEASRNRRLLVRAQQLTNSVCVGDSDGLEMQQLSNGTFSDSVTSGAVGAACGGSGDEDDFFDASETSRLVVGERSSEREDIP